jgi:hypothetical protein
MNSNSFRQCELSADRLQNFIFLRYNSDSKVFFEQELGPFLKARNVSADALRYIEDRLTSTRTEHSTSDFELKPLLEKRIRSSSYLMQILMRLYYNDYRIFNFTLPEVPKE